MSSVTMNPETSLELIETLESNAEYESMRKRFEESFYGFVSNHCEEALLNTMRREFSDRNNLASNASFVQNAMARLQHDPILEETPTLFLSSVLKTSQNV
jgi:ectoine hydroxylase-related dioxygenase (phytanoyl-CoA dioxygenase family)